MKISKIEDNKKRYMSLLFLADEQEDMIDRYLEICFGRKWRKSGMCCY